MAIDLPPTVPTELITAEPAEARGQALALSDGTRFFQIYGNTLLDQAALAAALQDASTSEEAMEALAQAYRNRGYFLVSVRALDTAKGTNLYVLEQQITELDVPDPLHPYFDQFEDTPGLKAHRFRRAAVLAQTHARQAGYEPFALYPADDADPHAVTLDIKVDDGFGEPYTLTAGLSNYGNRFVGEYFASADASYADVDGNRYRASIDGAFEGAGASEDDGDLIKGVLGYDRITPLGQFALDASYVDYDYVIDTRREFQPVFPDLGVQQRQYEGATLEVSAEATQLLYAGDQTRLIIAESIRYADDEIIDTTADAMVLDEQYTVAGLRGTIAYDFGWREHRVSMGLTTEGLHALSADTRETGAGRADAEDEFSLAVVQGSLGVDWTERLSTTLMAEHQWSFDPLPQNEEWVLGGPNRIAAYLPGALEGDEGLYSRFEIAYERIPISIATLEASVFYEYGTARFEQRAQTPRQSIADAGITLTTRMLDDRLALALTSAHPTDRENVDRQRLERIRQHLFFEAQWSF